MALFNIRTFSNILKPTPLLTKLKAENFHNTCVSFAWAGKDKGGTKKFLSYNDVVYPPQGPGEEPRPAFVCHQKLDIRYSPWKMWYVAVFVRGMSVDEAIKQLKFVQKKGARYVRETIEEARELAVKEHNVEFASNLWVAESMVGKGQVIKGLRRHARARAGKIEYIYSHYFVRLEEGKPPKTYYQTMEREPHEQLDNWLKQMRKRKITNSI